MPEPFLHLVARDLLRHYGADLSRLTVVFPSQRAGLFMGQHLTAIAGRPVWAPRYTTIAQLIQRFTPYTAADPIEAVARLYIIYKRHLGPEAESIDQFWSWGETLLADFNDVDAQLAPADQLFRNARDLEAIATDYLTADEAKIVQDFFQTFTREGQSQLTQRFVHLWDHLLDIYREFKHELAATHQLYPGAICREALQALDADPTLLPAPEQETFAIVGLNVLSQGERRFLSVLQRAGLARFYWDYDEYYTSRDDHEAAFFMRQNIRQFPMRLDVDDASFDNLRHLASLTFVATATENAAARYAHPWLAAKGHLDPDSEQQTAIVLADEHLLSPVLHSLPADAPKHVNVTMGYPMSDTPVYSLISALLLLRTDGYNDVAQRFRTPYRLTVSRHPYGRQLPAELVEQPAAPLADYLLAITTHLAQHLPTDDALELEALFRAHTVLNRFHALSQDILRDLKPHTLARLIDQALRATTVPYHGEPAIGLQLMGLLETRTLDFRHLLLLAPEEGIIPRADADTSLIPPPLREAYHLTTFRHRVSVYAYYFYRLLQRAESATLVYCDAAAGSRQHEMSRFMRQLAAEAPLPIRFLRADTPLAPPPALSLHFEKTPELIAFLRQRYTATDGTRKTLSPSALNVYAKCPLQFYLQYVEGYTDEQLPADELDSAHFGTIFHDTAELLYLRLRHRQPSWTITAESLNIPDSEIDDCLDLTLDLVHIHRIKDDEQDKIIKYAATLTPEQLHADVEQRYEGRRDHYIVGQTLLQRRVLRQYIDRLLDYDRRHTPFTILDLEGWAQCDVELPSGLTVTTGGRIDRLHRDASGQVVVLDYKTGHAGDLTLNPTKLDSGEKPFSEHRQTLIYAHAVARRDGLDKVLPALYYTQSRTDAPDYSPLIDLGDLTLDQLFPPILTLIDKIFDDETTFEPKPSDKNCQFCPFKALCGQ